MKRQIVIALIGVSLLSVGYGQYQRISALKVKRQKLLIERDSARQTISTMVGQQQRLAALDAQHTQELNDAKDKIAVLERDVQSGQRRLQLSATCIKAEPAGAARLDNATLPRLTDAAQRHYFTLRGRIEVTNKQIASLQDYIRNICLVQ